MLSLLKGVRILDVSRVLAGPFCSMMLADLGAEVIKVESPEGDLTRSFGPPFLGGESGYYLSLNRNKRSLCLDLTKPEGKEVLYAAARRTDIFIENFRPGVAERLGIDFETFSHLNEEIIYCSISGYGQDGPSRERPSFDIILQAVGGLMGITGEEGGPPIRIGVATADLGAGLHAAIAILAALWRRSRTGVGEYIDVSILDGQISWLTYMAQEYFLTSKSPRRMGSRHPHIMPYQAFPTSDGHVVVAAANDRFWRGLCKAVGREDLADAEAYSTNERRVANRDSLESALSESFRKRGTHEWVTRLQGEGVPCAPVNSIEDVFSDPQVLHRGMVLETRHPSLGRITQLGLPFRFASEDFEVQRAPPQRGEHTTELLLEMGYTPDRVAELYKSAVVF